MRHSLFFTMPTIFSFIISHVVVTLSIIVIAIINTDFVITIAGVIIVRF